MHVERTALLWALLALVCLGRDASGAPATSRRAARCGDGASREPLPSAA